MTPFGEFNKFQQGSRRTDGRGEGGADAHGARGQQQLRHRGAHAAATSAVGAVGTLDAFLEEGRVNHTGDAGLGQGQNWNYGELWGTRENYGNIGSWEISRPWKSLEPRLPLPGEHWGPSSGSPSREHVEKNVGKMWLSSKRCRSLFSFTQILTFMFTIHGRSRS